jgi:hypothetical protein
VQPQKGQGEAKLNLHNFVGYSHATIEGWDFTNGNFTINRLERDRLWTKEYRELMVDRPITARAMLLPH